MKQKLPRVILVVAASCAAVMPFASSGAAAVVTTLTFMEPETGATFAFIDNAPKTGPGVISAGDGFVIEARLEAKGRTIGSLQASCVTADTTSHVAKAEFICTAIYKLAGQGTLTAQGINRGSKTNGAITGGTGAYAGAHGTFTSKGVNGGSMTTVTLLE